MNLNSDEPLAPPAQIPPPPSAIKRLINLLVILIALSPVLFWLVWGRWLEPDPWPGRWRGSDGESLQINADGKIDFRVRQGQTIASGTYRRIDDKTLEINFTTFDKRPGLPYPVPQKTTVTLGESKKSFEFNRVRYRREE